MGQCKSKSPSITEDLSHFERTYTITSKLGSGGFGQIYTAIHNLTNHEVVVKQINKRSTLDTDLLEDTPVPREVKTMSSISHPNVVELLDFYSLPKHYLMILEYLPGWQDLFDYSVNIRYLDEDITKKIMKQTLDVLHHLHTELKIAHLDIKPENILINPTDLTIKLIDFGAATYITGDKLTVFSGTRQFASPDVLFRSKYDPVHADIWAAGVMLYRLVLGDFPFKTPDDYYIQLRFPRRQPELSIFCKHLISLMLCRQSDLRPKSVSELFRTPFLM
ncbi:hypothetical protein ACHWQZ_G006178 [Mnemiopsis leidyi]